MSWRQPAMTPAAATMSADMASRASRRPVPDRRARKTPHARRLGVARCSCDSPGEPIPLNKLRGNFGNSQRMKPLEKPPRLVQLEHRVSGLDAEEKPVGR